MGKTDNEKLVVELYEKGLSPKEIHSSNRVLNKLTNQPVSLRWIQMILKNHREKSVGRTSFVSLFSFEDIKNMNSSPEAFEEIARKRFRNYYIKRTSTNNGLSTLRLANKVLRRDDFKCRVCGKYYDLECHHVSHKYDGTRKEIDTCMTLCRECHIKKHKR